MNALLCPKCGLPCKYSLMTGEPVCSNCLFKTKHITIPAGALDGITFEGRGEIQPVDALQNAAGPQMYQYGTDANPSHVWLDHNPFAPPPEGITEAMEGIKRAMLAWGYQRGKRRRLRHTRGWQR
jgi:hypothetical protein